MSLPMLQVALDNQTMDSAYETTRLIAEEVDIIEVGTILCVGEGVRAVRDLKALYPHKIVLADAKIADAGKILSRMCFEANADWVTVICCADINTAKGALDVAKEFNGDVQIELTGYWTWEQAQQWRDAGIQQVVYHRSRDAQAAGVELLSRRYLKTDHGPALIARLQACQQQINTIRRDNFTGSMLRHHHHKSTQYMAQWIEAKNRQTLPTGGMNHP